MFSSLRNRSFVELILFIEKWNRRITAKTDEKTTFSDELQQIPTKKRRKSDELLKNISLIMDFLKRNGKITTNEVQKLTGLKSTQSKAILHNLQEKGYIKKIGKTKGSYYILINDKE